MAFSKTLLDYFLARVDEIPDKKAILERRDDRWIPYTWREWNERSRAIAASLMDDGVEPGQNVGIFSYSRRQWVESDIAILMTGARTVTIYQSLGKETVDYILEDSSATVLFLEGPIQFKALCGDDGKAPISDKIRRIVYFTDTQTPMARPGKPPPTEITLDDVVPTGMLELLVPFEEYVRNGRKLLADNGEGLDKRIAAVTPDTVAKIVYTSGTTGQPKGAILTHGAMASVVATIDSDVGMLPDDICLLFLPLAHVYAQLTYHAALRTGFTTAFARSMLTAIDDAESIKPNFFTTVPRLYEKIHAGVLDKMEDAGGLKKKIFDWAVGVGSKVSEKKQHGEPVTGILKAKASIADRLVFSKIKARLGGRIRFMVSGGAPIQRKLIEFFHAADLLIVEGYGMTENSSLSHFNRPASYKFGTVGQAGKDIDVKIADDGEILVRGQGVMVGYLNKPEETAKALDSGGWLHTGDIGVIDDDGFLTITDRKKDLIVTSGGKNIAPAPIEARLVESRFVSQGVVFGDGRKFLVALLTLDSDYAQKWAQENNVAARGMALASDPKIKEAVSRDVDRINRQLESYETIKKFAIMPTEFSMDAGEVTPSLKLRKRVIERRNKELIESLYPSETGRC